MKAADAIVKCLIEQKTDTVFGYPGGFIISVYESIRKLGLHHVLVRQEQAAAHSANGYARISGKVGVCIATSGPGATNLITGIATAYMDSIPMVIITGQVRSNMIGRDVFQEADITGATESFTKHSYLVKQASDIPRIISEAFFIASTGRPGPVLIDIPFDIQETKVESPKAPTVSIRGYKPTTKGHAGQVKRAVKSLSESSRPLIVAGGGIALSGAWEELAAFVEKTGIPLVHTLMGKGTFPTAHPAYVGMIGTHGDSHANQAVARADALIFLGARIADRSAGGTEIVPSNMKIIHVDVDPAEIGKNVGTHIPVVGDVKLILKQFLDKVGMSPDIHEWKAEIEVLKAISAKKQKFREREPGTIDPKNAVRVLSEKLDSNAILVTDVGQNQFWAARNFEDKKGRRFLTSGGLGTMGYGLPASLGAKIAAPSRQVVAVVGDGGFQMSLQELGTLVANDVGVIILLFNNNRLGMVREMQDRIYGSTSGVLLDKNPDFIKLCDAYGIPGVRVTSEEELEPALDKALKSKGPFIVECRVDPEESTL